MADAGGRRATRSASLALLAAVFAVVLPRPADALPLADDDECQAGNEAEKCTLSALQRRGRKVVADQKEHGADASQAMAESSCGAGGAGCFPVSSKCYELTWSAQGRSFFDNFTFLVTRDDGTHGASQYVTKDEAFETNLTVAEETHAIIRTGGRGWNLKRKSVNIHSNFMWSPADHFVVALRFTHLPHGCGIWPAFWTKAPGTQWPNGGELDIIESANGWKNKVSFHLGNETPCTLDAAEVNKCRKFPETNSGMNYDSLTDYHTGRLGTAPNAELDLTGEYLAKRPGIMAAEFTGDFVKVFYIPDDEMPEDLATDRPRPATWDKFVISFLPFAASESARPGSCRQMREALKPQELVFNIGLCGDWAGGLFQKEKTCSAHPALHYPACVADNWKGDQDCCTRFIWDENGMHNASEYLQERSFFNITWLKVYQDGNAPPPSQPPPPPPPPPEACSNFPECAKIGLGGNCCPTPTGMMMGCCKSSGPSACARHPKCKALGLQGACCPTEGGARMGCCEPEPGLEKPKQHPQAAVHAHLSATASASACGRFPKCAALGLAGDCCPNSAGIKMGCCEEVHATSNSGEPGQAPVTPSGIFNVSANASACARAPKCAALGLAGECCPNAAGVRMGCCDELIGAHREESPKPNISDATADSVWSCAKFPRCAKLGLTGACCPNAAGVRMGCCDEIAEKPLQSNVSDAADGAHACAKFPRCAELGLAGACCPNAAGMRMGCCDEPALATSNESAGSAP